MLALAVEAEVQEFLARHQALRDDQGRRRLVRNGYLPGRSIQKIRTSIKLGNSTKGQGSTVRIKHPAASSGVLTALLQFAGLQPAFAPRDGELNPKRLNLNYYI